MTTDDEAPAPTVPASVARAQVGVCLGCGTLILLSFLALGYTVWRSDRQFTNDPTAVEATLQSIVPCEIPAGYRGFVGADVPGKQRIAVVGPTTLEGKRIQVDVPLLISVWTFPPELDTHAARTKAVTEFWATQVADRALTLGTLLLDKSGSSQLTVRGEVYAAQSVEFVCERATVKLLFVQLPRAKDSTEIIVLAFTGDAKTFDTEAMQSFLDSIP